MYSENFYTYVFDETGALVFYNASGYVAAPGCPPFGLPGFVTAGMLPPLTDCRGCLICGGGGGGGDGGQGGVGAEELADLPGCVTDAQGRIAVPP